MCHTTPQLSRATLEWVLSATKILLPNYFSEQDFPVLRLGAYVILFVTSNFCTRRK